MNTATLDSSFESIDQMFKDAEAAAKATNMKDMALVGQWIRLDALRAKKIRSLKADGYKWDKAAAAWVKA